MRWVMTKGEKKKRWLVMKVMTDWQDGVEAENKIENKLKYSEY